MLSPDWLNEELQQIRDAGLLRRRRVCQSLGQGWSLIDGRRVRDFSGNDYLGLSEDPRVVDAARTMLESAGCGARGSALICGRTPAHLRLEERLAAFEQQPAAILFPTGMAANVGTISTLAGPEDTIFCDRWNHASLVDGCRLSGARFQVYRHDDLESLERRLTDDHGRRRCWIVTDTVFSMDGDLAPLPQLCDLAERYQAELIVDEAHGTGVFGASGRGVCEQFDVEERVAVRIGTLSKGLGALGGFVTGSQALIDYLWNTARTQMFSTALPPVVCAAATASLEILMQEPGRVVRLQQLCQRFRTLLADAGIPVAAQSVGPIVPVLIGEAETTLEMARRLEERGLFVGAIRPPTVPRGTSRLRVSLSLAHDMEAIEELAAAVISEFQRLAVEGRDGP